MTESSLNYRQILTHPVYCLAFGFGTGLMPKAPGTFGTLLGIPLVWALQMLPLGAYIAITILLAGVGIYLCGETARMLNKHDHPGIVWDEVVGYLVAMLPLLNFGWYAMALGFVLFRIFDIVKPWPIGWADSHLKGGLGIMFDDILAGAMAALVGYFIWQYNAIL